MITKSKLIEWSLFALMAFIFCFLLSLRPVPSIYHPSDTGRYVQSLHKYCANEADSRTEDKETSYAIFYAFTSPACLIESDNFFMFEAAFFFPLIFLLLVEWHRGTLIWASSLMFSMVGLEMMTNALRQSLATLFLFSAIALWHRHKYTALLLAVLAALAHNAIPFYLPLFVLMSWDRIPKKTRWLAIVIAATLLFPLALFIFSSPIQAFFDSATETGNTYSEIFVDQLSTLFILYMTLPLYWVYGVRHFLAKDYISDEEKQAIIYSTIVLIVSYFLFPAILYRFALLSIMLQIFLAARSKNPSLTAGVYVFIGMLAHLVVMLIASNYYSVLIYG